MKYKHSILILMLFIGVVFSLPIFAETQDELKQIFVTRNEFEIWANNNSGFTKKGGDPVGMSEYLATIEIIKQESIQAEVEYEMWKRDILPASVSEALRKTAEGRETLESWEKRKKREKHQ